MRKQTVIYIQVENYSETKKNKLLITTKTWMKPKNIEENMTDSKEYLPHNLIFM